MCYDTLQVMLVSVLRLIYLLFMQIVKPRPVQAASIPGMLGMFQIVGASELWFLVVQLFCCRQYYELYYTCALVKCESGFSCTFQSLKVEIYDDNTFNDDMIYRCFLSVKYFRQVLMYIELLVEIAVQYYSHMNCEYFCSQEFVFTVRDITSVFLLVLFSRIGQQSLIATSMHLYSLCFTLLFIQLKFVFSYNVVMIIIVLEDLFRIMFF